METDYAQLANAGMTPELLAETFLENHFGGAEPEYPVNPFKILRDCGVVFSFRPFEKYEGLYIPAEGEDDIPVVGINLNRPITRQRYTAAHELCHHLKDARSGVVCPIGSRSKIERYAEKFAACLLMPRTAMARQIDLRGKNGCVTPDGVLQIADFFGVSFAACVNRVAFDFHALKGYSTANDVKRLKKSFGPDAKRRRLGMTDAVMYRQLLDSVEDIIQIEMNPSKRQRFKANYVYHDSRMEGVTVDQETASEIVVDLRINGSSSRYCDVQNSDLIEVAGLAKAYDFIFDHVSSGERISVYDAKIFNEKLFSLSPHPEFGGRYRESNTLVMGAKFETMDYRDIPAEFLAARKNLDSMLEKETSMTASEYIEAVVRFHHQLTVLHPFRDGNGRSARGMVNILLMHRGFPPALFVEGMKVRYKNALAIADRTGNCNELFCIYCSQILESFAILSDTAM
ncbi:ImmA/IrrE family metallo-endopeptidase [Adlercreutzia sp. ZJ141]|uniref:ImmA/IrrE family metallo-endopeptidase n=1 Tax=Adlercreutzia sp. ZJ141 TaxID=2709406 RepID=UPI0013EC4CEA|nr:ImmA/IrrE family metallo-endopeptidase [Adlercreutzia sp. ZJ141]